MCHRAWPETVETSFHWVCSQTGAASHSWASVCPTERHATVLHKHTRVLTVKHIMTNKVIAIHCTNIYDDIEFTLIYYHQFDFLQEKNYTDKIYDSTEDGNNDNEDGNKR